MKFEELIERDSEKMSGTPLFPGTRVPIARLFDHLKSGESLDTFLDQFPSVSREQVVAVINASLVALLHLSPNPDLRLDLMREAATDKLFLADLNATMHDFGHADQEDNIDDFLTMDRLARKP